MPHTLLVLLEHKVEGIGVVLPSVQRAQHLLVGHESLI
jgi:hypothetical protein